MTVSGIVKAKVDQSIGREPNEATRLRRIKLGLMHDAFHQLEAFASELSDARRLAGSARVNDHDGDEVGARYDRTREVMARRASGRALFGAVVSMMAAVRISAGDGETSDSLTAGLEGGEREWLAAVIGGAL